MLSRSPLLLTMPHDKLEARVQHLADMFAVPEVKMLQRVSTYRNLLPYGAEALAARATSLAAMFGISQPQAMQMIYRREELTKEINSTNSIIIFDVDHFCQTSHSKFMIKILFNYIPHHISNSRY